MDVYDITEERFEELNEWDRKYKGEQMYIGKKGLLERMAFDAQSLENANYHGECAALIELMELVEIWDEDDICNFAYHVNDLGAVRNFRIP